MKINKLSIVFASLRFATLSSLLKLKGEHIRGGRSLLPVPLAFEDFKHLEHNILQLETWRLCQFELLEYSTYTRIFRSYIYLLFSSGGLIKGCFNNPLTDDCNYSKQIILNVFKKILILRCLVRTLQLEVPTATLLTNFWGGVEVSFDGASELICVLFLPICGSFGLVLPISFGPELKFIDMWTDFILNFSTIVPTCFLLFGVALPLCMNCWLGVVAFLAGEDWDFDDQLRVNNLE